MIKAVVFDLDGVVRHFGPAVVARIEQRHGLAAGVIPRAAFTTDLLIPLTTGELRRVDWITEVGVRIGNAAAASEWGEQRPSVDADIVALAYELHARGLVTAILTNGTDTIPAEMAEAGLDQHFSPIFNSAEIGSAKPDERVFRHVLTKLDLSPGELFFTDDSASKLIGATSLGIVTHHFTSEPSLRTALRAHGVDVHASTRAG